MPTPRTPDVWRSRIFSIKANDPRIGRRAILQRLRGQGLGPEEEETCPSERTIGRILEDWENKTEEERRQYFFFRWPEAMQEGLLPWEASRAALDLLHEYDRQGLGRPSVRVVRWYWHVLQALPLERDENVDRHPRRVEMARILAAIDELGPSAKTEEVRQIEMNLASAYDPNSPYREFNVTVPANRMMDIHDILNPRPQKEAADD